MNSLTVLPLWKSTISPCLPSSLLLSLLSSQQEPLFLFRQTVTQACKGSQDIAGDPYLPPHIHTHKSFFVVFGCLLLGVLELNHGHCLPKALLCYSLNSLTNPCLAPVLKQELGRHRKRAGWLHPSFFVNPLLFLSFQLQNVEKVFFRNKDSWILKPKSPVTSSVS